MFSRLLVSIWLFVYGKLRIRGAGLLIRLFYPVLPGLKSYPIEVPGVGTVKVDFAESAAYSLLLTFKLNDLGTDVGLYRAIESFLGPGGVLWDVGGFAGYISAYFAHPRFQLASIETFEPNPDSLSHLRRFFASSPVVKVHPYALGSVENVMKLAVPTGSPSTASLVQNSAGTDGFTVEVKPGDEVVKQLLVPMPDVIKIDVEGFETEVIRGLEKTISQKRPVIAFEHIFLTENQILDIAPISYRLFFIGDDGVIYEGISFRGRGHDALLVPAENDKLKNLKSVKS